MTANDWTILIPIIGAQIAAVVAAIKGHSTVKKELTPNGGASLRDAVDRLHDRLDRIENHLGLDD